MTREARIAAVFTELADTLVRDFDVVEFLDRLAGRCVELLGVPAAGIMLVEPGGLRLLAASREDPELLDLFDRLAAAGPCPDAVASASVRSAEGLDGPGLSRTAALVPGAPPRPSWLAAGDMGDMAVDCMPMRLRSEVIGAVALLRPSARPLAQPDVALAVAMADIATIGVIQQRTISASRLLAEQLQAALDSRVVLEQAKGALAERAGLDVVQAFELMRGYARRRRRRLADVARDVLAGAVGLGDLRGA